MGSACHHGGEGEEGWGVGEGRGEETRVREGKEGCEGTGDDGLLDGCVGGRGQRGERERDGGEDKGYD